MATQLSVHDVTRITARAPMEFLPQKRGERGFWSRTLLLWQGEEIVEVLVFGATEAALLLPGEKPAEARLDAYAAQARMVDPQDFASQAAYDAACLPETDGEVDLAAEADFSTVDPAHPQGCSCGSPDCPQWQASQLGVAYGPD